MRVEVLRRPLFRRKANCSNNQLVLKSAGRSAMSKRAPLLRSSIIKAICVTVGCAAGLIACASDVSEECYARVVGHYLDLMELSDLDSPDAGAVERARAEFREALHDCPVPRGGLEVPMMGRWSPAELAVAADDFSWVSKHIDSVRRQARSTAESAESASLLNVAAGYATRPMVELLIANGFDVNRTHLGGKTPLMVSAHVGLQSGTDNSEALLRAGADVNAIADNGTTALYYAVLRDSALLVELHLMHGASVRPRGSTDDSIVSLARKRGHAETVKLIQGADALATG
jgi:hypothetical protein